MGEALITCPRCSSDLIQIEAWRANDRGTLLDRRCPECGHRDVLSMATAIADLLREHAAELSLGLEQLADDLEATGELWLSDV